MLNEIQYILAHSKKKVNVKIRNIDNEGTSNELGNEYDKELFEKCIKNKSLISIKKKYHDKQQKETKSAPIEKLKFTKKKIKGKYTEADYNPLKYHFTSSVADNSITNLKNDKCLREIDGEIFKYCNFIRTKIVYYEIENEELLESDSPLSKKTSIFANEKSIFSSIVTEENEFMKSFISKKSELSKSSNTKKVKIKDEHVKLSISGIDENFEFDNNKFQSIKPLIKMDKKPKKNCFKMLLKKYNYTNPFGKNTKKTINVRNSLLSSKNGNKLDFSKNSGAETKKSHKIRLSECSRFDNSRSKEKSVGLLSCFTLLSDILFKLNSN